MQSLQAHRPQAILSAGKAPKASFKQAPSFSRQTQTPAKLTVDQSPRFSAGKGMQTVVSRRVFLQGAAVAAGVAGGLGILVLLPPGVRKFLGLGTGAANAATAGQKSNTINPAAFNPNNPGFRALVEVWKKELAPEDRFLTDNVIPDDNVERNDTEYRTVIPADPRLAIDPPVRTKPEDVQYLLGLRPVAEAVHEIAVGELIGRGDKATAYALWKLTHPEVGLLKSGTLLNNDFLGHSSLLPENIRITVNPDKPSQILAWDVRLNSIPAHGGIMLPGPDRMIAVLGDVQLNPYRKNYNSGNIADWEKIAFQNLINRYEKKK